MIVAKVVDSIWSTRKMDSLVGFKFMLVEVLGGTEAGRLIIAVDLINAGIGERVIVCVGSSARQVLDSANVPIDAAIIGIVDETCKFVWS